jgi:hypothetical protein
MPVLGGLFNKNATCKIILCIAHLGNDALSGMLDGTLLLWKDRTNTRSVQAHDGPVTSMCSLGDSSGNSNSVGKGSSVGFRVITGTAKRDRNC